MKRHTIAALVAAPVALTCSAAAHAQDASSSPWTMRLTAVKLSTKSATDITDSWGYGLGLGYEVPWKLPILNKPTRTTVELDWANNTGKGGGVSALSLGVAERISLGKVVGGKGVPYVGLGLGVGYLCGKEQQGILLPAAGLDGGSNGGSNGGFATEKYHGFRANGRFMLGLNLSERAFVEASYSYIGSVNGIRGDAAGVTLGVRF